LGFGFALFADAAAALKEFDELLQTEGDDEAHADGDEVEEHCFRLRRAGAEVDLCSVARLLPWSVD